MDENGKEWELREKRNIPGIRVQGVERVVEVIVRLE